MSKERIVAERSNARAISRKLWNGLIRYNRKMAGPFRYTRNPMYSGLVMIALGFAFYFGTLPFYVVPVLLFLLCNFSFIPFEEAKMQRQFGDQFTDYLRGVRRWV